MTVILHFWGQERLSLHSSEMETNFFFFFLFSNMVLIIVVLSFLFSPEHIEVICLSPSIPLFHPRDKSHWERVKWGEKWKKRGHVTAGHRGVLLLTPSLLFPPSFINSKVRILNFQGRAVLLGLCHWNPDCVGWEHKRLFCHQPHSCSSYSGVFQSL